MVDGLSIVLTGKERWTAISRSGKDLETQYNGVTEKLGVSAPSMEVVYFNAPGEREKEKHSSNIDVYLSSVSGLFVCVCVCVCVSMCVSGGVVACLLYTSPSPRYR